MTAQLPWDRFEPAEIPQPELPYVPPAPVTPPPVPAPVPPAPPPSPPATVPAPNLDIGTVAREALTDALEAAWPALREQAVGYARDSVEAIMAGQTVDLTHPRITAETATGKQLVVADAKSRSARTFVQGLAIDVFAAVVMAVAALAGADPFAKETWILLGALLLKTVIQTAASYVMRLKVTPTMKTEGEKLAIMPVPRPMINEERKTLS